MASDQPVYPFGDYFSDQKFIKGLETILSY